jgi:low affinity Fe/Cu permease
LCIAISLLDNGARNFLAGSCEERGRRLIQNTQNRDGAAIQAKLDELVRVTAASNSFIGIEHLTVEEVNAFRQKCKAAADKAGKVAVQKAGAKARKAADKAV